MKTVRDVICMYLEKAAEGEIIAGPNDRSVEYTGLCCGRRIYMLIDEDGEWVAETQYVQDALSFMGL